MIYYDLNKTVLIYGHPHGPIASNRNVGAYFKHLYLILKMRGANLVKFFPFQGSCRVLTHLSKKTAKLNRSAVSPEKPKAVLPEIPIDEADRRRALYTGTSVQASFWELTVRQSLIELFFFCELF